MRAFHAPLDNLQSLFPRKLILKVIWKRVRFSRNLHNLFSNSLCRDTKMVANSMLRKLIRNLFFGDTHGRDPFSVRPCKASARCTWAECAWRSLRHGTQIGKKAVERRKLAKLFGYFEWILHSAVVITLQKFYFDCRRPWHLLPVWKLFSAGCTFFIGHSSCLNNACWGYRAWLWQFRAL